MLLTRKISALLIGVLLTAAVSAQIPQGQASSELGKKLAQEFSDELQQRAAAGKQPTKEEMAEIMGDKMKAYEKEFRAASTADCVAAAGESKRAACACVAEIFDFDALIEVTKKQIKNPEQDLRTKVEDYVQAHEKLGLKCELIEEEPTGK